MEKIPIALVLTLSLTVAQRVKRALDQREGVRQTRITQANEVTCKLIIQWDTSGAMDIFISELIEQAYTTN